MTPSELRHTLSSIQAQLKSVERVLEQQKSTNSGYYPIGHEVVEAWEAVDRAVDLTDQMVLGSN